MVLLSLFKGALFYQSKLERTEQLFQKQFPSPVIFCIPLTVFFNSFTWIRAYSVPKQFLLLLEPVVKSQTFVTHPPATHHRSATMEMIIITQYLFYCKLNSDIFK